jgi:hypothetical protein
MQSAPCTLLDAPRDDQSNGTLYLYIVVNSQRPQAQRCVNIYNVNALREKLISYFDDFCWSFVDWVIDWI